MKHICTHEKYREAAFEIFKRLSKEEQARIRFIISTVDTAKFITLDGKYHDVAAYLEPNENSTIYRLRPIEKPDTKGWYEEIHALVRKHRLPRNYRATT